MVKDFVSSLSPADQVHLKKLLKKAYIELEKPVTGYELLRKAVWRGEHWLVKFLFAHGCPVTGPSDSSPLHLAVMRGDSSMVEILLENHVPVDVRNSKGETALHLAFIIKNYTIMDMLIKHINGNTMGEVTSIPDIVVTCMKGSADKLERHLEKNVDPNTAIKSNLFRPGYTALHFAAYHKRMDLVKRLLQAGANAGVKDAFGVSPLDVAVQANATDIVEVMMNSCFEAGVSQQLTYLQIASKQNIAPMVLRYCSQSSAEEINAQAKSSDKWPGYTALHFAAYNNSLEAAQILIQHGADVNVKNYGGKTPIHLAFHRGHEQMVKLLLPHCHGTLNPADDQDISHFHLAVMFDCTVMKNYIAHGVDVNKHVSKEVKYYPHYAPIHMAVTRRCAEAVEVLLKNGADVNRCAEINLVEGYAPIHIAIYKNEPKIVKLLLDYGADINAPVPDGGSCLEMSLQYLQVETTQLLIDAGANTNSDDNNPPIFLLALQVHELKGPSNKVYFDLVRILWQAGCNLNATNLHDETVLHMAVVMKNASLAQALLLYGADINIEDCDNLTPYHNFGEQRSSRTWRLMIKHAQKLVTMKGDISEANIDFFEDQFVDVAEPAWLEQFRTKCEKEIDKMAECVIHGDIDLSEVLHMDPVEIRMFKHLDKLRALTETAEFSREYPLYGSFIKLAILESQNDRIFREKASHCLADLTADVRGDKKWPERAVEKIFSYLGEEDMRNLIRAQIK